MKEVAELVPDVIIDKSLNRLNNKVLFPEKLKLANEILAKGGLPKELNLGDEIISFEIPEYFTKSKHVSKKLQKANEILARVGVPDLEKILSEDKAKKAKKQADLNQLGTLIKQTRLQRNLSEEALAALLGVENTVIFRLENNDTTVSMETILQVFHVLDAELSFVVTLQK